MKILIDEDLPRSLVRRLCDAGFDAVDVRDQGLQGQDDDAVLAHAKTTERLLITLDVRRFGDAKRTPPVGTPGFVVVRMPAARVEALCRRVVEFLRSTEVDLLRGTLTIVEPARVRRLGKKRKVH